MTMDGGTMDAGTRAVMEALAGAFPAVETMTGAEARAAVQAMTRPARPLDDVAAIVDDRVAGGPAVRVYRPVEDSGALVVALHGGGFVLGDLDGYDPSTRALCAHTGATVVAVDYRLAPEHPFPAALDDTLAALAWTAARFPGAPIAVYGDSAGANLAAAACLAARDAGSGRAPLPDLQVLAYPILDPAASRPSQRARAEGWFLTGAQIRWYWRQYLGDAAAGPSFDPLAAPIAAADLRDLPPAIVVTAEYDPLRDEGEEYAARLAAAGAAVLAWCADGLFHGYLGLASVLPAARAERDRLFAAMRTWLLGRPG